jgi:RluA family pseudouridine synthase
MSKRISAYERHGRDEDGEDALGTGAPRPALRRHDAPELLLDDPRCVVVAKPAGVPTVPERFRKDVPTIVDLVHALLLRRDPAAARPLVVHRLDKDTSGALVLAKDADAARDLTTQFEERAVEKSYVALVLGAPQPPEGEVEFRVDPDPRRKGAMALVARGGRDCRSSYETLETFRGVSLVRVRPLTGRTHQVRLTLLHLGTPCAIDPVYGGDAPILLSQYKRDYRVGRGREETPLLDRLSLHAESVAFRRPGAAAGDPAAAVRVEAPLPRDLSTTLRQLRRWAAPGSL